MLNSWTEETEPSSPPSDTITVTVSQLSRPVSPNLYATTEHQQINLF